MKFRETLDVNVPAEFAFSELSDHETIERLAMQRGVAIRRTDRLSKPGPGMSWRADWEWGGRKRRTNITLTRREPPKRIVVETETAGVAGRLETEVVPMTAESCRLIIESEVRAVTFAAKVVLQTIKLARGRIERAVGERIGQLSARLEARYAASKAG